MANSTKRMTVLSKALKKVLTKVMSNFPEHLMYSILAVIIGEFTQMALPKKYFSDFKINLFFVGNCRTGVLRITYFSWLPSAGRGLMVVAKGSTVSQQFGVHNVIRISLYY